MSKKLSYKLNDEKINADTIVIDSYDDTQHHQTSQDRTSIASLSSQVLTPTSTTSGLSTSDFLNIELNRKCLVQKDCQT